MTLTNVKYLYVLHFFSSQRVSEIKGNDSSIHRWESRKSQPISARARSPLLFQIVCENGRDLGYSQGSTQDSRFKTQGNHRHDTLAARRRLLVVLSSNQVERTLGELLELLELLESKETVVKLVMFSCNNTFIMFFTFVCYTIFSRLHFPGIVVPASLVVSVHFCITSQWF